MAAACGFLFFRGEDHYQQVFLPVAIAFFVLALLYPVCLARPRHYWLALGEALSRVTQPLILGVLFFLLITPVAIVWRRLKANLTREKGATFWLNEPRTMVEKDFERQF